uniref:Uncharacterized protein n=1 Tax=Anopheles farauti TaxID=69004 RepID=A0A182QTF1_9DIPT
MKTKSNRIVQHTIEFDSALVTLLVKNETNLENNDEQLWRRIASGICEVSGKSIGWKELRQYYKFYVVTKLKKIINDQQLIDKLQYAWLERVYKVRVLYNCVGSTQSDPLVVARNKLLIKYAIDNRYDGKIVSTFKRLHNPQLLNKISINVENPAYELTKDLQLFLLKPTKLRNLERLGKRFSSKLAKLPWYHQPAVTGQQRNHQHSVAVSGSPILLDNASVCIEDASLPNTCNSDEFSPRDLLEKESLNIKTQEFLNMQQLGEVEVAEHDGTRVHNPYWQPEEYANLVPDIHTIFSDEDEEDEEEEEEAGQRNEKNASDTSAEKENLYRQPEEYANLVPDIHAIFSDEDEEEEEEEEEAGEGNEKNASTSAEKGTENDHEQPTAASDYNGPSTGSTQSEENCPNIISSSSAPEKDTYCEIETNEHSTLQIENRQTEQFSLLLSASIFCDEEDEDEVGEDEVGRNEMSDNSGEILAENVHEQPTAASDCIELDVLTGEHYEQPDQTVKLSTSSQFVTELGVETDPLSDSAAPISKSVEESVSCGQRTVSLSSNSESSSSNSMNTIIFRASSRCSTSPEQVYTAGRKQKPVLNATFPQCLAKRRKRASSSFNTMDVEDQDRVRDANRNVHSETGRSADLEAIELSANNHNEAATIDEHSSAANENPAQDPAVLVPYDAIVLVETADSVPPVSISPIAADRLAQVSSKLDAVLTQKLALVQTLRVMEPALFFRPASTVQRQLKISHQLIVLQLLVSAMRLHNGTLTHLLPILNRIAYGDFAHPTR